MTNGHIVAIEEPYKAQGKQMEKLREASSGREESAESVFQLGLNWFVRISQTLGREGDLDREGDYSRVEALRV